MNAPEVSPTTAATSIQYSNDPLLVVDYCWFLHDIPVELRMIIHHY
jgi:hypothetical protein